MGKMNDSVISFSSIFPQNVPTLYSLIICNKTLHKIQTPRQNVRQSRSTGRLQRQICGDVACTAHLPQSLQFLQLLVVIVWILPIIPQNKLEEGSTGSGLIQHTRKKKKKRFENPHSVLTRMRQSA